MSKTHGLILGLVLFGIPFMCCGGCFTFALIQPAIRPFLPDRPPPPDRTRKAPRADAAKQAKQLAFVRTLIDGHVVQKADARNMYVWPSWSSLSLDDKILFTSLVWCWANQAESVFTSRGTDIGFDYLVVRDARTGAQLATYCPDAGLRLD